MDGEKMDDKLINNANENLNDTFVLFNELIKDFNECEVLKNDEKLQKIIENIQKQKVDVKNVSDK